MNKMMKQVMVAALACVAFCGVSEAKDLKQVKAPAKAKVQVVVKRVEHRDWRKHDLRHYMHHDMRRHECKCCKFDRKRKEVHHHVCKR